MCGKHKTRGNTYHCDSGTSPSFFFGRLYRAGTGYTVLPAILPAVEGIILRMLRALKKNLYKKPKKAKKKKLSKRGFEPGHPYS